MHNFIIDIQHQKQGKIFVSTLLSRHVERLVKLVVPSTKRWVCSSMEYIEPAGGSIHLKLSVCRFFLATTHQNRQNKLHPQTGRWCLKEILFLEQIMLSRSRLHMHQLQKCLAGIPVYLSKGSTSTVSLYLNKVQYYF